MTLSLLWSGICVFGYWFFMRCAFSVFFFFSSRRRHTRSDRDWSSDVFSSDLDVQNKGARIVRKSTASILIGLTLSSSAWGQVPNVPMTPTKEGSEQLTALKPPAGEIGRASCRERV